MRVAHDSSFCGRSQGGISRLRRRGGGRSPSDSFPIAPATPSGAHLLIDWYRGNSWQVAAALSAAVTTTKLIGERPHSQGRASPKKETTQTPATLWERGSGGEALLLEKRPLPQSFLIVISSEGSAREGASLQRSPLPRIPFSLSSRPSHKKAKRSRRFSGRIRAASILAFSERFLPEAAR